MPYLEKDIVTGIWKPTKETVEAVKKGTLFVVSPPENGRWFYKRIIACKKQLFDKLEFL